MFRCPREGNGQMSSHFLLLRPAGSVVDIPVWKLPRLRRARSSAQPHQALWCGSCPSPGHVYGRGMLPQGSPPSSAGTCSSPALLQPPFLFLILCSWPPRNPRPGQGVGASRGDRAGMGAGWWIRVDKGQKRTQLPCWGSRLKHGHQQSPP